MTQRIVFRVVLPLGRPSRPIPDKVSRKVSRLLRPWLADALESGQPLPLPFPAAAGFRAAARQRPDGLVVELTRPFEDSPAMPRRLAAIGVAARASHLPTLCRHLGEITGTACPMPAGAPCCLVIPDGGHEAQFPEMEEWLEEFADGVARAWLDLRDGGPVNPPRGAMQGFAAPGGGRLAGSAAAMGANPVAALLEKFGAANISRSAGHEPGAKGEAEGYADR